MAKYFYNFKKPYLSPILDNFSYTVFFLTNQLQESPESLTGERTDPHLSSELRFKLLSENLYWNEHPTGKENHC